MAENIMLHVLVEDQAGVASALLEAAGPERAHEVQAQTGGFLVPGDIAATAGLVASDAAGDVKADAKPAKAAAKADA